MLSQFVHLQCHSEYSLVDGLLRVSPFVKKVAEFNMPAVALTDQSNLFAMVKFYQAAVKQGVKPIIGSDLFINNEQDPSKPYRFIVLCQNKQGYANLTQLISNSYLKGQATGKPVICKSWLRTANKGLIVISASGSSDIGQALAANNTELAETLIEYWSALFPDCFYLGITRTGRLGEDEYIAEVVQLALRKNIPVVATNDVCFMEPSDFDAHEARVCISDGVTLDNTDRIKKYSSQQYLRSSDEMAQLFSDIPEAIENTVEISKRCSLILDLDKIFLPNYPVPANMHTNDYLSKVSLEGLEKRITDFSPDQKKIYQTRLQEELRVINSMGFAGYFLIVADFIKWAYENGVPVGPGRGSGAGSLVAYALNITSVDPLEYDLLFERFLNSARVSMPDFDIDFCMEGRDRVIEYVAKTYGRDSVSQIITYGTMAAKAVVRDVGRVLGYSYGFVDKIAKLIPLELGMTLEKALQQEEILADRYQQEEEVKVLIDLAKKLEGITRNVGKHAGGVVIAPSKLTDYSPLYCEANDSQLVTQFDKNDVEKIGLVKFDFLGLRTLTIINWSVQAINNSNLHHPETSALDITKIPLDCTKTFELLCSCKTTAVFQLESRGMKDLIRRLRPDRFEDIVALVALFRPGPLQSGMVDDFIDRKLGQASIVYPHPDLEPILESTYGVILYQEQVMQIAQTLAGYSLGEADLLRRAMGKKKPDEMAKQREIFTKGAIARGVESSLATYIFDLMEKFAGYGFNKSHSVAYALLSYQTAWLKTHYPAAFMAAVLSSDMANTDKVVMFIEECRNIGIKVLPPDINKSTYKFSVIENSILYGLGAIKGIGESAISNLIKARSQEDFADLFALCSKIDSRKVSKRVIEALINSGALDALDKNRAALINSLDAAINSAEQMQRNKQQGQIDMFGNIVSAKDVGFCSNNNSVPMWSDTERLAREKMTLGLYLTGHPISAYELELSAMISCKISKLHANSCGQVVTIAGFIVNLRIMQTKRGDKMAFINIDDKTGRQEIVLFSNVFKDSREILQKDNLILVEGEVSNDEYSGGIKIKAFKCLTLQDARTIYAKNIVINIDAQSNLPNNFAALIHDALKPYQGGSCPVIVKYKHCNNVATLAFGKSWIVKPTENLIKDLNSIGDYLQANVSYK